MAPHPSEGLILRQVPLPKRLLPILPEATPNPVGIDSFVKRPLHKLVGAKGHCLKRNVILFFRGFPFIKSGGFLHLLPTFLRFVLANGFLSWRGRV